MTTTTRQRRADRPTEARTGLSSVSVIVPTRNESANVAPLVSRVKAAMANSALAWEVVFVDDSDDDTPQQVNALTEAGEPVRLLWRAPGERHGGLSGAVIAGFRFARGDAFVVIDGDLQHPPELLPAMIEPLVRGDAELVAGTRYSGDGADRTGLAGGYRRLVSGSTRATARLLFGRARSVSDPLGGFFSLQRHVVEDVELRPDGFKILLEILVRGSWSSAADVPYRFADRAGGRSKATWKEGARFFRHVLRLRVSAPMGRGDGR